MYQRNRLLWAVTAMNSDPQSAQGIAHNLGIDKLFEVARASTRSFVYLLDSHDTDNTRYFKIGRSIQPHIRLRRIRTGKGAAMPPNWNTNLPVRPLAIRDGAEDIEAIIHRDLREYRIRGTEWFVGELAVAQYVVEQDAWDIWRGEPMSHDYDFSMSAPA